MPLKIKLKLGFIRTQFASAMIWQRIEPVMNFQQRPSDYFRLGAQF